MKSCLAIISNGFNNITKRSMQYVFACCFFHCYLNAHGFFNLGSTLFKIVFDPVLFNILCCLESPLRMQILYVIGKLCYKI